MSNTKHTTGPWFIEQEENSSYITAIGPLVANSYCDSAWLEVKDADAHLIAASPDLLDACKNLLTLTQILANDEYEDIALVEFEIFSEITKSTRRLALADELAKARAAIAKATGAASSATQAAQGGEA